MDYSAIGQTAHLAARMEQLAAPGSIRLTAETLRLVEGMVQVTPLGPVPVKGLPYPMEVFELIGAGPGGGAVIDFYDVFDHVLTLLRQQGRVSYRALKVQFHLDDEQLDALKEELLYTHQGDVEVVAVGVAGGEGGRGGTRRWRPEAASYPCSMCSPASPWCWRVCIGPVWCCCRGRSRCCSRLY